MNRKWKALFPVSITMVLVAVLFVFDRWVTYQVAGILLLVCMTWLTSFFDVIPVLMASLIGALLWNFLLIPPQFTFHIEKQEDLFVFASFLAVSAAHVIFSFQIKKERKRARLLDEKAKESELYKVFFNSISHELKTPLASISSSADVLCNKELVISEENKHELLNQIQSGASRLHEQLDNFLTISRVESGAISVHEDWIDPMEMAYSVVRELHLEGASSRVVVQDNAERFPLIRADLVLIKLILTNLLRNALHHTKAESRVWVEMKEGGNEFHLIVQDEGPLIPPHLRQRVLEKFFRVENARPGGSGVGLSIVKGVVEILQGSIVIGEKNGGNRVMITIPVKFSYVNQLKYE